MVEIEKIKGDWRHADLANSVADAMSDAMEAGLDPGSAVSVAANVVADYWRSMKLGTLDQLAEIVRRSDQRPSPVDQSADQH